MGETQRTCFYMKDNAGLRVPLALPKNHSTLIRLVDDLIIFFHHIPKPVTFQNQKIQNTISNLCSVYCLYFFYPIERLNYPTDVAKNLFWSK